MRPKTVADKGYKLVMLEIKQIHIERAVRKVSTHCAVAEAVKDKVPEASRVVVDLQTVRFTANGKRYVYLTPFTAQEYIVAFDAGDPLQPFKCQLRDPHVTTSIASRSAEKPSLEVSNGSFGFPKYRRLGGRLPPKTRGTTTVRTYGRRRLRENAEKEVVG